MAEKSSKIATFPMQPPSARAAGSPVYPPGSDPMRYLATIGEGEDARDRIWDTEDMRVAVAFAKEHGIPMTVRELGRADRSLADIAAHRAGRQGSSQGHGLPTND